MAVIALVGRPNVGKSTLFNRLTRTRAALVADLPGLTRDRQYGVAEFPQRSVTLIDTGGLMLGDDASIVQNLTARQVSVAVDEADVIWFVIDLQAGISARDEEIAQQLRRRDKPILLVANKIDGARLNDQLAGLFALGLGDPAVVSAAHGRGIDELITATEAHLPASEDPISDAERGIVVGVIGRPNVGKSTLVNRLLGEERVVVCDLPGTTRDSIYIPFDVDGERFTLVDTAGIRRRGRVFESVEKFSVVKTLEAIRESHVALLLIDAQEGLVDQDLKLLGFALHSGRSVLLVVNKWDGLHADQRDSIRSELDRRLVFAPWVKQLFISALHGSAVGEIPQLVRELYFAAHIRFSTHELTEALERIVETNPPPAHQGRRIKLRYAHVGGSVPPTIVIHGSQAQALPVSYRRYLENSFRKALGLTGAPVRIELRSGDNPYAQKKNELSDRQKKSRKRVIAHRKQLDRRKARK